MEMILQVTMMVMVVVLVLVWCCRWFCDDGDGNRCACRPLHIGVVDGLSVNLAMPVAMHRHMVTSSIVMIRVMTLLRYIGVVLAGLGWDALRAWTHHRAVRVTPSSHGIPR